VGEKKETKNKTRAKNKNAMMTTELAPPTDN